MRIGILGSRGIPNNYGGYEQFAQYISLGLLKKGHAVYVYNSSRHPYKEKEWNGVQIIHCKDWEHKFGTAGQFLYDRNCINDARKRNFDILLHLGYTSDSVWHRRWPNKTVNIVNMDGLEWKRSKYNRLTRHFLKWAESLAVKNADALVADSAAIRQHILDAYNKQSVLIPYGATVFTTPHTGSLDQYRLKPYEYFMVIARMEPENNIEMIIKGYITSGQHFPLLMIGDISGHFGKYISQRYRHSNIIYAGSIFDITLLNNLRYYSKLYFHGHSVGGTNPSLLEAMACGCSIAAHNNVFNQVVLQNEADYFSTENEVAVLMNRTADTFTQQQRKMVNLERIRSVYNPEKIINEYEQLMLRIRQ